MNRTLSFLILLILMGADAHGQKSAQDPAAGPDLKRLTMIGSDKARYAVGEPVQFSLLQSVPAGTRVRYLHLDSVIADQAVRGSSWNWTPPVTDFAGYLVELYRQVGGKDQILSSVAVDVASDWGRHPRYGFLSKYGRLTTASMDQTIGFLNRCHINGLQFYDWQSKHHQPLAGTVHAPASHWTDIANRDTYLNTVRDYIALAHRHHINCLFYNLIYGALKDASPDSVSGKWYAYTDQQHQQKEVFRLPDWFVSDIYLLDPANAGWQEYLGRQNNNVYRVFDFDGYHIDQLGNRDKNLYDYDGHAINLPAGFPAFINAMKQAAPDKALVMNSVNQYGQAGLARSAVNFLYTEVWPPNDSFIDLSRIIKENDSLSGESKKTVLTAYMDYKISDSAGYFNDPGILLSDAVIFAFGATHLELGEHMLGREYFPAEKLVMKETLQQSLIAYYDFQTAYENLLQDAGEWNNPDLKTAASSCRLAAWPGQRGDVAVIGKRWPDRQIIQLINFNRAGTMEWRDPYGKQQEPRPLRDIPLTFTGSRKIKKIWVATPDNRSGTPLSLPFSQQGDRVSFSLPYLRYWDVLVLEY